MNAESDFRARAPRWPTESSIVKAKQRWGVSALAFVYRLHTLGMISDWHYNRLSITFRNQYGSGEPEEMARETSQVLAKVMGSLRREKITRTHIANALDIHTSDLDELVFGLVLTPISGNGSTRESPSTAEGPHLRALK